MQFQTNFIRFFNFIEFYFAQRARANIFQVEMGYYGINRPFQAEKYSRSGSDSELQSYTFWSIMVYFQSKLRIFKNQSRISVSFSQKTPFVNVNTVLLVNVRATIVMIRIEVFGLEYVYSVILYFAIASPNSKWPSCYLSAKSQFQDSKISHCEKVKKTIDGKMSKVTGLPRKILVAAT